MKNKFIKVVKNKDQKYIQVLGIKVPYNVIVDGEKRTAKLAGILRFTYYRDDVNNSIYVKCFGKDIILRESNKLKRYKMRHKLDYAACEKIIIKEVSEAVGYKINLDEPKSYIEKINWLKLNNPDPRITRCCDKFAVKDYVREKLGDGYVVPTIASWEDPDEIDFDALPDKFVLKVNWASGYLMIVKDKSKLDYKKAREKIRRWIQPHGNSYNQRFNWGYKNMKPVIYAEEYIEQLDGDLYDYKFLFSKGKLVYLLIVTDRNTESGITSTFFDANFEKLPIKSGGKDIGNPELPKNLDKMVEYGRILADDFPLVRIDFYEIGDEIKLGEMTFYCGGGILPMTPKEWDYKIGELIDISGIDKKSEIV